MARSYLRPSMTGSRLVKALDEVGGEVDQVLRRRCFERSGGFSTFPKACGGRAGLVGKVCDGAANTRDSPFYMDVRALVPPVSFPVPCSRATHPIELVHAELARSVGILRFAVHALSMRSI